LIFSSLNSNPNLPSDRMCYQIDLWSHPML
jgi:hypothetical protein